MIHCLRVFIGTAAVAFAISLQAQAQSLYEARAILTRIERHIIAQDRIDDELAKEARALAPTLLRSTDFRQRVIGTKLLKYVGQFKHTDALCRALRDKHQDVAAGAAIALAAIRNDKAIPALVSTALKEDSGSAPACISAIATLGGRDALKRLLTRVRNVNTQSEIRRALESIEGPQ